MSELFSHIICSIILTVGLGVMLYQIKTYFRIKKTK